MQGKVGCDITIEMQYTSYITMAYTRLQPPQNTLDPFLPHPWTNHTQTPTQFRNTIPHLPPHLLLHTSTGKMVECTFTALVVH